MFFGDGLWMEGGGNVDEVMDKLLVFLSPIGTSLFLGSTIGPYLSKRAGERFAGEGDDVVGKWAPLKDSTVAIRESQNYPGAHPINRRSGELENWVVDGGWDAYPTGFGASLRYPGTRPSGELKDKVLTAQAGREFPKTVARPVLGVNENDLFFLIGAYTYAMEEAVK